MLWVDLLDDAAIAVLRAKLLMGKEVPLTFGIPLALSSSAFFLKKPAMDVWLLELEVDLVSEGVGVPRALFEDLEEGAICQSFTQATEKSVRLVTSSMLSK